MKIFSSLRFTALTLVLLASQPPAPTGRCQHNNSAGRKLTCCKALAVISAGLPVPMAP